MLIFLDASYPFRSCYVTKVSDDVYKCEGPVGRTHSRNCSSSAPPWTMRAKLSVSCFYNWNAHHEGGSIDRDHRYIWHTFSPDLCRKQVSKATSQRLKHQKTLFGRYIQVHDFSVFLNDEISASNITSNALTVLYPLLYCT